MYLVFTLKVHYFPDIYRSPTKYRVMLALGADSAIRSNALFTITIVHLPLFKSHSSPCPPYGTIDHRTATSHAVAQVGSVPASRRAGRKMPGKSRIPADAPYKTDKSRSTLLNGFFVERKRSAMRLAFPPAKLREKHSPQIGRAHV